MRKRSHVLYLWVAVVFAASEVLARALGIRFAAETLGALYQYLDPAILREDLAAGLFFLHAQPPLFNLALGLGLKAFPDSFALVASLLFGAMGLALLLATAWLMRRLAIPGPTIAAVVAALALSPNFLVYRNWLFYTLPVALMLVAAGCALIRFLDSGGRGWLGAFAALAGAVMLTRSVFHPIWLVLVVIAVWPLAPPPRRRALAVASLAPLLIVNLWFVKNQAIVGSYSGSTWLGMNLAKRWPLSQREVKELKERGRLPEFWSRRPFMEPDEYARFGFFDRDPGVHPALGAPYKSNGEPNFNHRDYVRISEALLEGDLQLIRRFPVRYARRTLTALLLYLQPGPNSVHFLVDYDFDRVHRYRDVLTRYLFLGGEVERPIRILDPRPNLMLLLFPLLLAAAIAEVRRGPPERRAVYAFLLANVVWVTAISNLIEIGENDRMRWEVEPLLAVFLAALLASLGRKLRIFSEAGRV